MVPGDEMEAVLSLKTEREPYKTAWNNLHAIYHNVTGLTYLYIYQIRDDGCYVLYDFAPDNEETYPLGTWLPFDANIERNIDRFLAGQPVAPAMTNDASGWHMTGYQPVLDAQGKAAAYACTDISMVQYVGNLKIYGIETASIIFGLVPLFAAFSLWFAKRRLIDTLRIILTQARDFKEGDPERWLDSAAWETRKMVTSRDELEELYRSMCSASGRSPPRSKRSGRPSTSCKSRRLSGKRTRNWRRPLNGPTPLTQPNRNFSPA